MPSLLQLFFFLLPFQFALAPTAGADVAIARVAVAGITLTWLVLALVRKSIWIPRTWVSALFVSFLFLSAFSILFADNPAWGARKLLFLLNFAPLYFVLADTLHHHPEALQKIARTTVWGSVLAALVALGQFCSQFILGVPTVVEFWRSMVLPLFLGPIFGDSATEYSSLLVNVHGATLLRATAFFPDPHVAAYYFGMTLALGCGIAWRSGEKKWLFAVGLLFVADILTFSRGGYIGLVALFLVFGLFFTKKTDLLKKQRNYFIVTSIVIAFTVLSIFFTPIGDRFRSSFSLEEGSNEGRIAMWRAGYDAIASHPITGVGLGNFSLFVKPSADYREPIYAHNLFLDIMAETGILNGLIFILLIMGSIFTLWQYRHSNDILLGTSAGLALFLTHSLAENPLFSVHILPLFLLFVVIGSQEQEYCLKQDLRV